MDKSDLELFIEEHLEKEEMFIKRMKYLFPDYSDEYWHKEYMIFCKSEYNIYLRKKTSYNDPGTIL
jgi:hypothetical protein